MRGGSPTHAERTDEVFAVADIPYFALLPRRYHGVEAIS